MENKIIMYVIIRTFLSLICFTILAIYFNNYWLVFGALLFNNFKINFKTDDKNEVGEK